MKQSIRCTSFEIEQYFRGLLPHSLVVKINSLAAIKRRPRRRIEGNVKQPTLARVDAMIAASAGKRITYAELTR